MCVLAHPDGNSFCAAIANELRRGIEVAAAAESSQKLVFHDLYKEGFSPVMELEEMRRQIPIDNPARKYINELQESQHLIVIFPDWWGAEPAILKGFWDRILRQGIAYTRSDMAGGERGSSTSGLLSGLELTAIITSDSSDSQSLEENYIRRYEKVIGKFCGFSSTRIRLFSPVRESGIRKRRQWLETAYKLGLGEKDIGAD